MSCTAISRYGGRSYRAGNLKDTSIGMASDQSKINLNVVSYCGLPNKHEQRSTSIASKTFTVPTYDAI